MAGKWTKREADDHVCNKPKYGESLTKPVRVGDEWSCECGKLWIVLKVTYGDQRDPIPQGYISHWAVPLFMKET